MIKIFTSLFSITLLLFSLNVTAQWSNNPNINNAICTAVNNQQIPEMISDGNGGAIITWQDYRNGDPDIYAQRINSSGMVLWATDGVSICSAINGQYGPIIISDGSGGAIITWADRRNNPAYNAPLEMYSQHIDASGIIQWPLNGMPICTSTNVQELNMVSDSIGGAIITWSDNRNGTDYNIFAQRINFSGVTQWTTNGLAVCSSTNNEFPKSIINDGFGGAIITWNDNSNFYSQRINSSGAIQWNANGVIVGSWLQSPNIIAIPDGLGGAIFSTYLNNNLNPGDIYLQHINNSGIILWNSSGVFIGGNILSTSNVDMISDGSGGAIITWNNTNTSSDIYVQRINYSGLEQWATNGVLICNTVDIYYRQNIVSDGSGGAIVIWPDKRNSGMDLYAQKINNLGVIQWGNNGVAVSTATTNQEISKTISDGEGGIITTWIDKRVDNTVYDVYAQKIYSNGAMVGINEIFTDNNSIKIFPNPNNGKFIIEAKKEGKYSIINEIGQTIETFNLDELNNYNYSLKLLTSGIYFIVGKNDIQITNQKIVVIN